jgi:hypothetical protein
LRERIVDFFFNDARTFGVVPTAFVETGFGLNFGARLLHRDLAGRGESLNARVGYGGRYRWIAELSSDTGQRLPRDLNLGLVVRTDARPRERFFGLGSGDAMAIEEPVELIDPRVSEVGIATRYRRQTVQGTVALRQRVDDELSYRLWHRWRYRDVDRGDEVTQALPWLDEVFEPAAVAGFGRELVDASTGLLVTFRRSEGLPSYPASLPSRGIRLDTWAGWEAVLDTLGHFGFVGFDLLGHVDLYAGDRVLQLRLRGETALGPNGNIPFVDLPTLGGPDLLRGYVRDRFRGKVTLLSSAEYRFPVQPNAAGFLFVDVGRPFRAFHQISYQNMRMGFGGGLLVFTPSAFLFRLQIASSIDGGIFAQAVLSPCAGPCGQD